MKPLIAGNWKMHGMLEEGRRRASSVAAFMEGHAGVAVEVALCPPAPLLLPVREVLAGSGVELGGQDCHYHQEGAHTGDISAAMLRDAGCRFVVVGHSERRADHNEDNTLVRRKAEAALEAALTPIICVGETLEQREIGQAEAAVAEQLRGSLPAQGAERVVVAYEPVWAIGSGRVPEADEIVRMHAHIIALIPENVRVLYGGSVKAENAPEILSLPGVHGVLVGGASLDAEAFCAIIHAAVRTVQKK